MTTGVKVKYVYILEFMNQLSSAWEFTCYENDSIVLLGFLDKLFQRDHAWELHMAFIRQQTGFRWTLQIRQYPVPQRGHLCDCLRLQIFDTSFHDFLYSVSQDCCIPA